MADRPRARIVRTFAAAFGTCDLDTISHCVSDDLVWEFNGTEAGRGRAAFEAQMRSDLSAGGADVVIERLVEDGDTLVALTRGRFVPNDGDAMSYVSAEAYTFTGDKISHMRTYQPV